MPTLVSSDDLLEANSKLIGSEAFVEATGFSVGGWVAQIFSTIGLALAGALTAISLGRIEPHKSHLKELMANLVLPDSLMKA